MANMINVLNAILDNSSAEYQARVPVATQDNLTEVGSAIMSYKATENEFLSALVNKIAMVIVHNKTYRNPLAVLKKGSIPLGRNIEEIFTNPATGTTFDPTGSKLLERSIPDTKTIYHSMNRQGMYKATVSKAQLVHAFTSYSALEQLLNSIVNSIYSGDNYDEFLLMKNLFASAIDGGKIKAIAVKDVTDESSAREFVKAIKKIGQAMEFPSANYNSYYDINKDTDANPVITWTPLANQVLLLRSDIAVDVDVELLARAFNVSYAEMEQRIIVVDSFGTARHCGAILCDEAYVQVYDNLVQMENFHNGEGLYDNFIYHHWQTYSLSLFANATAFMFPGAYREIDTTVSTYVGATKIVGLNMDISEDLAAELAGKEVTITSAETGESATSVIKKAGAGAATEAYIQLETSLGFDPVAGDKVYANYLI